MRLFKAFCRGFAKGFKHYGHRVADVVNTILLTFVYFVAVGPTSIIAKIVGKSFLDVGRKKKKTYWIDKRVDKRPMEEYYRQF